MDLYPEVRQEPAKREFAGSLPGALESSSGVTQEVKASVWTTANLLTAARIVLIIPFLYLINQGRLGLALIVFFAAGITDFFDGYVARHFNQQSELGRFLDPMADKLLTTASFVVLALAHESFPSIPVWLAAAVVGRDLLILLGSLVVYLATRFTAFKPTMLGRVNTTVEFCFIFTFLVLHTAGVLTYLMPPCYWIVLASVVLSGADYVVEGVKIVRNH
ncbi:MAG TPA: CDP-alcohol phosphatidyltransferase family protein [Blastocatellia bacterium]|nr:CDP-alcohol phosphatidyltransferase family protein [Blastocatellia bacterium]